MSLRTAAHDLALTDLRDVLVDLGRRWACSNHRPRPSADTLKAWDRTLDTWIASSLPILLRDSRRRGERATCSTGREVIFGDNSPANWVFALALAGEVPDISSWTSETMGSHLPLTFLTKGAAAKRDLNRAGWKVCHIDPVSDRKRYKIEQAPLEPLEAEFRRFLSPRNIFLIPKPIAGAGEIPEVVQAVADFDSRVSENG